MSLVFALAISCWESKTISLYTTDKKTKKKTSTVHKNMGDLFLKKIVAGHWNLEKYVLSAFVET